VSDWGWPIVREYVKPLLPGAPLFPGFRADVVWHWHRETTTTLGLPEHLRVHAARHHWAVLNLRAGVPVRVVQCQLGHATPALTLGLYGAFLPSTDDRATWRAQVTSHEAKRRGMGEVECTGSAMRRGHAKTARRRDGVTRC
jgi:integrase